MGSELLADWSEADIQNLRRLQNVFPALPTEKPKLTAADLSIVNVLKTGCGGHLPVGIVDQVIRRLLASWRRIKDQWWEKSGLVGDSIQAADILRGLYQVAEKAAVADNDTAEKKTADNDTAEKKTAGADTAEKKTAGVDAAEKKTAGADTAEKKSAGADTAGEKANVHVG